MKLVRGMARYDTIKHDSINPIKGLRMKELLCCALCVVVGGVAAQEASVESKAVAGAEAAAVVEKDSGALDWDGGADLRVRQEASDHLPKRGGVAAPNSNYLRIRPRVWGGVQNEDFKLYLRLTDEFKEYFNPRQNRSGRPPDEVIVDNLYLDLYNLFDGYLDLRIGRQDFFGPGGPLYGAGRVLADGTAFDGSRTVFMDAIKATIKFDEKNALDLLAIYNQDETELSWGHPKRADGSSYKERPLNSINPGGRGMEEYGGGVYFRNKNIAELPFELYYFYKRETKERLPHSAYLPGRKTHTWGVRLLPQFTDTLSGEFEGAVQSGEKDGGAATSGYMGYAGLTYKPLLEGEIKPWMRGSVYYLSGDHNRDVPEDGDRAWDPLWARWPQFSELYVYSFMYGVGYWSNLIYPSLEGGANLAPGHRVRTSVGPMYAAVRDDLGVEPGDSGGSLLGWLWVVRYDFPLLKNIFGKRGDLTGHVTAEIFEPGNYYAANNTAYFLRWEVIARF